MTFLIAALIAVAVLAVYLAALATWTLRRDLTLNTYGRVARTILAWIIPVGMAVAVLRSSAELSPDSLPPERFLKPVRWLIQVPARRPNNLADEVAGEGHTASGRNQDD